MGFLPVTRLAPGSPLEQKRLIRKVAGALVIDELALSLQILARILSVVREINDPSCYVKGFNQTRMVFRQE